MPQGVPAETETCPSCGDDFRQLEAHFRGFNGCQPPEDDDTENGQGGYKAYYGQSWEDVRQRVLERDGFQCQVCGLGHEEHQRRDDLFPPDKGLHVHHKVPAKFFDSHDDANALDNLVALCADCHREAENNEGGL